MSFPPSPAAPPSPSSSEAPNPTAWQARWRALFHVVLAIAAAHVAAALFASHQEWHPVPMWLPAALTLLGAIAGSLWSRLESAGVRRLVAGIAGLPLGASFGWLMERLPGALAGAAFGAMVATGLVWIVEASLRRVPVRYLCVGFWSLLAAALAAGLLAGVIKLVIGRLDDDDLAFHAVAIALTWYWAAATGWLAKPDASTAAIVRQVRALGWRVARSPLLPFLLAIVVAGVVSGPAHARYLVEETSQTLFIRRDPALCLWPAAFAAAGVWILVRAWRRPTRRRVTGFVAALWIACAFIGYTTLHDHIRIDGQRLEARGRVVLRADVQQLDSERVTGRRFVSYRPVLLLRGGERVTLGADEASSRAARFLRENWAVPPAVAQP